MKRNISMQNYMANIAASHATVLRVQISIPVIRQIRELQYLFLPEYIETRVYMSFEAKYIVCTNYLNVMAFF